MESKNNPKKIAKVSNVTGKKKRSSSLASSYNTRSKSKTLSVSSDKVMVNSKITANNNVLLLSKKGDETILVYFVSNDFVIYHAKNFRLFNYF